MSSAAPKETVDKEPCREEGAEVFKANSAVVLVRLVKDARGKAKYEVKVKGADYCVVVDLIPEITSPTARNVSYWEKLFLIRVPSISWNTSFHVSCRTLTWESNYSSWSRLRQRGVAT
jgi:hypothetical protein